MLQYQLLAGKLRTKTVGPRAAGKWTAANGLRGIQEKVKWPNP
jgi:hypothetical protein